MKLCLLPGLLLAPLALLQAAEPTTQENAVATQWAQTNVFGDKAKLAAPALPWLAAAMTCLSISYLALQFLLALGRRSFLIVLAFGAVAVPAAVALRDTSLESVAIGLLVLDAILAALMLSLSFSARGPGKHGLSEADAEAFALAESSAAAESAMP